MRVANAMQRHAAADKPRFVISVGDNFYPKGVSGIDDPAWNESFEHVYTSPELQCPWYVVLGNHDHHGSIAAQIEYSSRSKRWVMLAEYYKRTESVAPGSDIDLFFLDTEPIASPPSIFTRLWKGEADPEEQVEWLDRELSTSKARWKIVVGHHPIVSVGRHGPSANMIERIKPLLERHGVHAYFNGHDHNLQHATSNGVHYFTSGGGSEAFVSKECQSLSECYSELGFLSGRITPDTFTVDVINSEGAILRTITV